MPGLVEEAWAGLEQGVRRSRYVLSKNYVFNACVCF